MTLMGEIERIQADLCVMQGMIKAVMNYAYDQTAKVEYIGNSLEVLQEYVGTRADELDQIDTAFKRINMGMDAVTGNALSDKCTDWEKYMADDKKRIFQSNEVREVKSKISLLLYKMPGINHRTLLLLIEELGAASRKQGFAEGMMAAIGLICGE